MTTSKSLKLALIGYGYWGKNIARVVSQSSEFELDTICDPNPAALESSKKVYPWCRLVQDASAISDDVDVVAVITPTATHADLGRRFLSKKKHVLITKPFAETYVQAAALVDVAEKNGVTVFVDHTFVFNPAVRKLKELLPRIGKPYFVSSQRLNLGLYQSDVNVIYDLMPHDLSIISYLFDSPIASAQTSSFRTAGLPQEDLAHASFELANGVKGLVTVSWLSPAKVRQFFIVGSTGMLSYDDNVPTEKVKFYDKGIFYEENPQPDPKGVNTARISYRNGDLFSPAIPNTEALATEMVEFSRAIFDVNIQKEYNRLNLNVMKSLDAVLQHRSTSA